MYRFFVAGILFSLPMLANAQGYVGVAAAKSNVGIDCAGKTLCDRKGFGVKLFAGAKLSAGDPVDAVEVGVLNFGKSRSSVLVDYVDVENVSHLKDVSKVGLVNALTFSGVLNFTIADGFVLATKMGVAYVSSTVRTYVDGAPNGSVTATKFKPYLGLAASFSVDENVKLVGSYDLTVFDVDGKKSHAGMMGLGAEMQF
ncbi:MAG: hypothetical protein Q7U28_17655 [Aquabacterium sp.]|nr:hypothetical protein [Aquabacterium sp.]